MPVTKAGVVLATSASRKTTRSPWDAASAAAMACPLPPSALDAAHHPGPGVGGLLRRVVGGAVVEHEDLVDQAVPAGRGQERLHHGPDHRAHGGPLVAGRDAHRDRAARPWPPAPWPKGSPRGGRSGGSPLLRLLRPDMPQSSYPSGAGPPAGAARVIPGRWQTAGHRRYH